MRTLCQCTDAASEVYCKGGVEFALPPQESASLREQLTALEEASTRRTTELAAQVKRGQDYIGQLMAERKQIDNKFHDMKTDLITRLQNACTQRDEARGRVSSSTVVAAVPVLAWCRLWTDGLVIQCYTVGKSRGSITGLERQRWPLGP